MKKLQIEWRHLDVAGCTCLRCSRTGESLAQAKRDLESRGIPVELREEKLGIGEVACSNSILLDGRPLEEVVPGVKVSENNCPCCSELVDREVHCRTVEWEGKVHEDVPRELIIRAALLAAGRER